MEASVTIICGTILALMQAYLAFRLKEQDNSRDAARAEAAAVAVVVKQEALSAALAVETKVDIAAEKTAASLDEIHILVNNRMSEALERVASLEAKLGLSSGEDIPNQRTITERTHEQ